MLTACFMLSTLRNCVLDTTGSWVPPSVGSSRDEGVTTRGRSTSGSGAWTLIVDRLIATACIGVETLRLPVRPGLRLSLEERQDNLQQHGGWLWMLMVCESKTSLQCHLGLGYGDYDTTVCSRRWQLFGFRLDLALALDLDNNCQNCWQILRQWTNQKTGQSGMDEHHVRF